MAFGFAVVFVYDDLPNFPHAYTPPPGLPQCQPPYYPQANSHVQSLHNNESSDVSYKGSTIGVSVVLGLSWAIAIPTILVLFHHYAKTKGLHKAPVDLPVMEEEMEKLSNEKVN